MPLLGMLYPLRGLGSSRREHGKAEWLGQALALHQEAPLSTGLQLARVNQ
jgi:hypothetical protein